MRGEGEHEWREGRKNCKINVPRSAVPCPLCPTPILASLQRIFELFAVLLIPPLHPQRSVHHSSRSYWPALRASRVVTRHGKVRPKSFYAFLPSAVAARREDSTFHAPSSFIMPMTRCVYIISCKENYVRRHSKIRVATYVDPLDITIVEKCTLNNSET